MLFLLGTHEPSWLYRVDVPLFVSHRRLARQYRGDLPQALGPWALDSGGFTELSMHGGWQTTPGDYVAAVRRYRDEIGHLLWAAPQDWMCEPWVIEKTKLSVAEHQERTVTNYLDLRTRAPDLPFIPVLQGWEADDYRRHVDAYIRAGVDLTAVEIVGLGTVCRRADVDPIVELVWELARADIPLHGFGVKLTGLRRFGSALASADSLAWSYNARKNPPMAGHKHKSCANCLDWALRWRDGALAVRHASTWQPAML